MTKRFSKVTNDELEEIINNKTARSTDYYTKNAAKHFCEYCTTMTADYKT